VPLTVLMLVILLVSVNLWFGRTWAARRFAQYRQPAVGV